MAEIVSLSNYFRKRPEQIIGEVIYISDDRSWLKIRHHNDPSKKTPYNIAACLRTFDNVNIGDTVHASIDPIPEGTIPNHLYKKITSIRRIDKNIKQNPAVLLSMMG